jgi:hypothetical protein
MIIHIDVWLDELKKLHAEFEEGCANNQGILIERALYYSALIIRKLSETPFTGRGFLGPQMKGLAYGPPSRPVDGIQWLDAWSHFDFAKGRATTISLADICHILIHSHFLDWRPASGPVRQILVVGGMKLEFEIVGFVPSQFTKMLRHVEQYKFKKLPARMVGRAA